MITLRCPNCGFELLAARQATGRRAGRPRRDVPVAKLSDAYHRTGSVRAAARAVGIPPATAWDRLKAAGLLHQAREAVIADLERPGGGARTSRDRRDPVPDTFVPSQKPNKSDNRIAIRRACALQADGVSHLELDDMCRMAEAERAGNSARGQ